MPSSTRQLEPEAEEDALMCAYRGGDARAFERLFARLAPLVLGIVRQRVRSSADAHDLLQQTFLQVHRARLDFRPGRPVRPWIVTIAMNLRRDYFRGLLRKQEVELTNDPVAPDPDEETHDPERSSAVRSALARLPEAQREVIELHWFGELSFSEIAIVVGASDGAVRVRAHRGYQRLRQLLRSPDSSATVPTSRAEGLVGMLGDATNPSHPLARIA